jgi:hypothetical protein
LKVLVINANTERLPNPVVPLGASMAASASAAAGFDTHFLDCTFEKRPGTAVRKALDRLQPDAVGISIRNVDNTDFLNPHFYLPEIRDRIVAPCLARLPDRVVLGGAGFSTMPEEILDFMGAPAGVVGDGEVTFPRLLQCWSDGRGTGDLSGLVRPGESGAVRTPAPDRPEDLDALPPARISRWVKLPRYAAYGGWPNLQTKRGCPLKCTYCVYNLVEGKTYRFRSPTAVRGDLEALASVGAKDAEFTDSTFNIPLDRAKSVCSEIASAPVKIRLHTSGMNPLKADEELFRLMAKAGFASIMISAESASDAALVGLQKGYDASAVHRILRLAKNAGFDTFWYFLFGGPGETEETVEETLAFLDREIPPHHLVYVGAGIRIQKGAPVEAIAREEGVVAPGESLLEPKFYFSPRVRKDAFMDRLKAEVLAHPNYIQIEDYQHSRAPLIMARILHGLRYRRPTWTVVPWVNRIFAKLGRKRR